MEDPDLLLARLCLGREEYVQRLLTMLLLDGPYPRWNTRSRPSDRGRDFLRRLDELSFGTADDLDEAVLIDEFDLGRRPTDLLGSAPDYAVLNRDRLWIIELKTERGNHRDAQLPTYAATAQHHYPDLRCDVTYLTGPMPTYSPQLPEGVRLAHVTWEQVLPSLRATWGEGSGDERSASQRIEEVIASLDRPWEAWRAERLGTVAASPASPAPPAPTDAVASALALVPGGPLRTTNSAPSTSLLPASRSFERSHARCPRRSRQTCTSRSGR